MLSHFHFHTYKQLGSVGLQPDLKGEVSFESCCCDVAPTPSQVSNYSGNSFRIVIFCVHLWILLLRWCTNYPSFCLPPTILIIRTAKCSRWFSFPSNSNSSHLLIAFEYIVVLPTSVMGLHFPFVTFHLQPSNVLVTFTECENLDFIHNVNLVYTLYFIGPYGLSNDRYAVRIVVLLYVPWSDYWVLFILYTSLDSMVFLMTGVLR